MYFLGASLLFILAVYQVNISGQYLEKQSKMMPAHLEKAFILGCATVTHNQKVCAKQAAQFRKDAESIYN
jgi:hypothetical protein